jgi:hypothetical protein
VPGFSGPELRTGDPTATQESSAHRSRRRVRTYPPISLKSAEKDGARMQYFVAESIAGGREYVRIQELLEERR